MLRNKLHFCLNSLLGLSIAVALCGCGGQPIKNVKPMGKNIVCFGDSITFGYGAEVGGDYPTALAKMVTMPVINAGVDGDTTVQAMARLDTDVLGRDPYLVIVEFAGNDFLKKVPIELTTENTRQIVRKIQAAGAMVVIADISAGLFMQDYRVAFKKIASEEGALFIPQLLSRIITNPSMKSDFLHPNASGYKTIAQRIYRAIKKYLK